jgi:hypothetical protein
VDQSLINQQQIIELFLSAIQLGGQYALPAAGLLRALYYGWQGKFPEGAWQIVGASFVAGLTSVADTSTFQTDNVLREIFLTLTQNAVFTAGLLAFIMTYIFRQTQNMSRWVDGIVGAIAGFVVWIIWYFILGQWAWWMIFIAVPGGAAALIGIRALMFVISWAVKIARWLLIAAVLLMLGGAVFLAFPLITNFVGQLSATPTPGF